MWSHRAKYPGEHYAYYRESSPDSNRECPDAGLLWPSDEPDALVDELVRSLTMSRKWLEYVMAEAQNLPENVAVRRKELEETLRRVQKEYVHQRLDEPTYLSLRRECEAELALIPSSRRDLVEAAERFESFGSLWTPASAETRNETCRLVFESVILDVRNHRLEVCPAPEFEPLFQLRRSLHVSAISPGPDSP